MRSNRKRINKRSYRRKSYRRRSSATKRKRKRSLVRRRSQRRSNIKRTYKKYRMKGGSRKMKDFVSNRIPQAYNKIKNKLKNISKQNLEKLLNSFEKEIFSMSVPNVMNLFKILEPSIRRGGGMRIRRMKGGAAADGAAASVWQPWTARPPTTENEAHLIGERVPGYVDLPPQPPLPRDADEREPAAPQVLKMPSAPPSPVAEPSVAEGSRRAPRRPRRAPRAAPPSAPRALPEPEPDQRERARRAFLPGQTATQRRERQQEADDAVDAMKESIMEYVRLDPREAIGIIIFSGLAAFSPTFRAVVGATVFTGAGAGAVAGAVGLAVPDTDRTRGNAQEGTLARQLLDHHRELGR